MCTCMHEQSRVQGRPLISHAKPDRSVARPVGLRDSLVSTEQASGNQAMQRLLRTGAIQAKLTVGKPGDIYEQEADRVAEQVIQIPEPATAAATEVSRQSPDFRVQRMCPEC